jgi:HTH-type transcriptional regulator, sugar sensing transcriptional regulator
MDTKILEDIGLTQGEIKVYLALLKLGSTTSGPLTDESRVSRSKIYNVLERLMQKGLVSFIIKDKTRYYQAAEPARIKEYLAKKEQEFKQQKENIDKLMPQLELQQKLGKTIKEAQIFEGFRGIQTVYEHIFLKLKKGEEYYYFGIPSFQDKKFHIYWQRMHTRRAEAGIRCRLLFNQGTDKEIMKNRNKYPGGEARYMPLPINTPSWIMGYKDTTVIGLQSQDGMAIEIINQQVADSFKDYFESFWKLSEPFH